MSKKMYETKRFDSGLSARKLERYIAEGWEVANSKGGNFGAAQAVTLRRARKVKTPAQTEGYTQPGPSLKPPATQEDLERIIRPEGAPAPGQPTALPYPPTTANQVPPGAQYTADGGIQYPADHGQKDFPSLGEALVKGVEGIGRLIQKRKGKKQ